jgi:hypothetical protein
MWQFMAESIKNHKKEVEKNNRFLRERLAIIVDVGEINKFIKLNYDHFHEKLLALFIHF